MLKLDTSATLLPAQFLVLALGMLTGLSLARCRHLLGAESSCLVLGGRLLGWPPACVTPCLCGPLLGAGHQGYKAYCHQTSRLVTKELLLVPVEV